MPNRHGIPSSAIPRNSDYVGRFNRRFDASLLVLPAFRKQIVRLLADQRATGRTTADAGHEERELLVRQAMGIRRWGLFQCRSRSAASRYGRVSRLRLDRAGIVRNPWDAAVRIILAARPARQGGGRLHGPAAAVRRTNSRQWQWPHSDFELSPLDHTATPEDVQAGRAIFSLAGRRRPHRHVAFAARVVPMDRAERLSLHQLPFSTTRPTGRRPSPNAIGRARCGRRRRSRSTASGGAISASSAAIAWPRSRRKRSISRSAANGRPSFDGFRVYGGPSRQIYFSGFDRRPVASGNLRP